jgi:hypothetical protein
MCCEVYIDDVIIHGQDEITFLHNVREVFERFRKYNVTLNPKKCKLGLDSIEFVGHEFDFEKMSFSRTKKDQVLNFPRPQTGKQLRQFLGLANYFRDHVSHHSDIARPLQDLLKQYDNKFIKSWPEEANNAFEKLRMAVGHCPSLYFPTTTDPIILQTDASDYGIGAYLYQLVDGEERAIAFISQSLHGPSLNWSVPEKECYAIYFALKKLTYIIRDVHFTIQTDHKNLTYLNMAGSPKVKRWKYEIMEYDFDVEYIPGEKNVVADAMSRLCEIEIKPITVNAIHDYELSPITQIPLHLRKEIAYVHNSTIGHFGVDRLIEKLQKRNHKWPYMRQHCKQFIKECPYCQKMQYIKLPIHASPFTTASYQPMEQLNWDTIGPLPPDAKGNKYILVIIDCFSRYVSLYPLPDVTAELAAEAFVHHASTYGAPAVIKSDRGTQFHNELMKEILLASHTQPLYTTAYSKEENGLVERANKEVMRHLRAIIFDNLVLDNWSKAIPLVSRIMNTSIHSSLQVAPADLLFGNAINLERGLLYPFTEESDKKINLGSYADKMLNLQKHIMDVAFRSQQEKDLAHMINYPTERTEYSINSYVLLDSGPSQKTNTLHKGPFRVINFMDSTYTIENLVNHRQFKVHISRLRPFFFDSSIIDPADVARRDYQEFVVESIIDHQGNPQQKSTLRFLVRWAGYDSSEDTWEPWAHLRDTQALMDYLQTHNLKRLIPTKFRGSLEREN